MWDELLTKDNWDWKNEFEKENTLRSACSVSYICIEKFNTTYKIKIVQVTLILPQ